MLKLNRSVNPVTKDIGVQRRHAVRAALFLLSTVFVLVGVAGDDRTYVVHYTKTDSVSDLEISNDLQEIVLKALSINQAPHARKAKTLLTLWNKVYCQITVVFTDSTLLNDASTVTKCTFEGLDAKMWKLQKK